ncbi:MAG TPA: hypothetical protein VM286_03835 [Candidatus Thermoplasmatota archaeon]|nr:hypothetical protein [Candidatus Thermoplasmatota archaeon]
MTRLSPTGTRSPRKPKSGLALVQSELAALLMEPGRMDVFEKDPRGHLRKAGLAGADLDLLAGLPVAGARFFAQRRAIDRAGYLRSDLPYSFKHLDEEAVQAYFAAFPYAFEAPMKEVARFAKWAPDAMMEGILSPLANDVIQVEAAAVQLFHAPHKPIPRSRHPKRAPGIRILHLGHDPEHFMHDHGGNAKAGDFILVLHRDQDDVEPHLVDDVEVALLQRANADLSRGRLVVLLVRMGFAKPKVVAAMQRMRKLRLLA